VSKCILPTIRSPFNTLPARWQSFCWLCPRCSRYIFLATMSEIYSNQELEILHQVVSDINKLKRQYSLTVPLLPRIIGIVWQVTNCGKIFFVGYLPQIHGKVTTSPAHRGKARPGHGSLTAIRFRNGKNTDPSPFYGFMGNVSCHPALPPSQRLIDLPVS
jgi:hypothetical protein